MKDRGRYRIPSTSILLAFESAARLGNFSQAGLELGTSQSAMSRYIARLETDLSVRLFERSRTGVTLTEAGRRFHAAVVVGLAALHDGTEEVGALSGSGPPEVTIACPEEVSHLFVMQRYDALKAALGERVRVRILAHAEAPASLPSEPVLFRTLFDAESPRLFDVIAALISQIARSFPDRSVGAHGLCGRSGVAV